ncbi:hypothetical protein B0H14DRAFT_2721836 [Mycena olivaceomarginata]|nr:hypothetical protein B0H14DRAFT_2721836 [Mycena olivaceomarginata]
MPINAANEADGPSYAAILALLFGVSLLQGYLYFTRYHDRPWLRCLLSIECLISAAITYAATPTTVELLMNHFPARSAGNSATIMKVLVATILLGTVGLGCVVYDVIISAGGLVLLFVSLVVWDENTERLKVLSGIARGVRAAADILATVAMCLFLKSADDEIIRPSSLLRSLMHLIINRGILVTAAQILLLVTFFGTPNHLYWMAVHINTTKLYVNTFFGMLNARTALVERSMKHTSRAITIPETEIQPDSYSVAGSKAPCEKITVEP